MIAARRLERAEQRFILSGADVALVDARGAVEEGLAAIRMIGEAVEINASALLVLLSKKDAVRAEEFLEAGATHYLASPFSDTELGQALRFAERHTVRLAQIFGRDPSPASDSPSQSEWRYDWSSDRIETGERVRRLLGIDGDSDLGGFLAHFNKEDGDRLRASIDDVIANREPTAFVHGPENGRIVHHISMHGDRLIARIELPDSEARPKSQADRDALTGFGDARRARQWIAKALGESEPAFAVLLIGLARFSAIKAALGEEAGDEALRQVARRIEQCLTSTCVGDRLLARIGERQFVIGLPGPVAFEDAHRLAEDIVKAIEQPINLGDNLLRIKALCGIVKSETQEDANALLRRASAALARARGGSQIRVHDESDQRTDLHYRRLELDLAQAIERDEIDILFQPQVTIGNAQMIGVEALARWQHPEFGELGAEDLFAAAERYDFLVEMSAHVQRKALSIAAKWPPELNFLRLSINVTAEETAMPDFAGRILEQAGEIEFPLDRLTLEVTESGLIIDLPRVSAQLSELRAHGLRIAIDDFGTGYSSLAYLKSLPLDYLKLDRKLILDLEQDERGRVIASGAIRIAKGLGLSVIAEGVETKEQLAILAEQDCDIYQGFLFSPPVSSDALGESGA